MHPPSLCQLFLGPGTGDCNPCKLLHPPLPTLPVSRSKWLKSHTRHPNWPRRQRKTWMVLLWKRVGSCPSHSFKFFAPHDPVASNHSIILHSENTTAGGLQEGYIYMISTRRRTNEGVWCLPTLVFRKDRVVQLVKRSKLFLVNEVELSEISSSHQSNCFSLRTSCTNRKKCR